ncbi:hypothetical protein ABPG75_010623 [Micractinium tetrahymenae]
MSLSEVPDDLLVAILSHLRLEERHTTAAAVCRRWRRLVNTPQLLAASEFILEPTGEQAATALPSFCLWLARHGRGHVRRLVLRLEGGSRAAAMLLAVAGPSLEELSLQCRQPIHACGWMGLEAMRGLRRLEVGSNGGDSCQMDADLALLTCLERLHLNGVDRVASLPVSLTCLLLDGYRGRALPRQIAKLTRLQSLAIWDCQLDSGSLGLAPLHALSGCLAQLAVRCCAHVPPGLSLLTSLQRLCLLPEGVAELEWQMDVAPGLAVLEALPHLRRLRHLAGGCMQLESFLLPALAAARSLCFLGVDAFPFGSSPVPPEVLAWAAGLPMLRHVILGSADATEGARAIVALRARCPRIIDFGAADFHHSFAMPPGVLSRLPPAPPAAGAAPAEPAAPAAPPLLVFKRYYPPYQFQRFLLRACIVPDDDSF